MTLTVTEFAILVITIFFSLVAFEFFLFLRKLIQTLNNVNETMDEVLPIIRNFNEISEKVNTGISGASKGIALMYNTGKKISKFSTIMAYFIIKPMTILMDILTHKTNKSSNTDKKTNSKKKK